MADEDDITLELDLPKGPQLLVATLRWSALYDGGLSAELQPPSSAGPPEASLNSRAISGVALPTLTHLAKAILPVEVSRALLTRGQATFAADYQDTLLLLVQVEEESEALAGLAGSTPRVGRPSFLPTRHLDYNTETSDQEAIKALIAASDRTNQDHAHSIGHALSLGTHFVVPLRKRAAADQISQERISVGRATNKDIVLRDSTVSKFHAWFELHEGREFSVADAGSTNRTTVNGEALVPRKLQRLMEGDRIKFGSVPAHLCSGEALWAAIHGSNQ